MGVVLKIFDNLRNLAENQAEERWWQGGRVLEVDFRENIKKIILKN